MLLKKYTLASQEVEVQLHGAVWQKVQSIGMSLFSYPFFFPAILLFTLLKIYPLCKELTEENLSISQARYFKA